MKISPYAKAAASFVAAAVVAYISATDGGVTTQEWVQVVLAGLAGAGVVYAVPNKAKTNQGGYASTDLIGAAILVGVVLLLFGVHFR